MHSWKQRIHEAKYEIESSKERLEVFMTTLFDFRRLLGFYSEFDHLGEKQEPLHLRCDLNRMFSIFREEFSTIEHLYIRLRESCRYLPDIERIQWEDRWNFHTFGASLKLWLDALDGTVSIRRELEEAESMLEEAQSMLDNVGKEIKRIEHKIGYGWNGTTNGTVPTCELEAV
jgi:hypothetical protein